MVTDQDIWRAKEYLDDILQADQQIFSDWEKEFIGNVRRRVECFEPLTDRMAQTLEAIYVKTTQEQVMESQEKMITEAMEIMKEYGTEWEITFLTSIHARLVERRQELTPKQAETLDKVYRELCAKEDRGMRNG